MTITIKRLCKFYGSHKVLNNINLELSKGEILGFVGANGAGKTTTIKILATVLSPDEGSVHINKINIHKKPEEIVGVIGYLPENNPLYSDLYVQEAINFIAKLRKPNINTKRINEIISNTGLGEVRKKKIKNLSKGYKQRLGIAQAIVHDPEVLILDEPSNGLDPIQMLQIRKLIKRISRDKAVIISTHLLTEVENLCTKVALIDKGSILKNYFTEKKKTYNSKLLVGFNTRIDLTQLHNFLASETKDSIKIHANADASSLIIECDSDLRKSLNLFASRNNLFILQLSTFQESLEDIFKSLKKGSKLNI